MQYHAEEMNRFQFVGEMYGNPNFAEPRPELTEEEVLADWENLRRCFEPDPGDLVLGEDEDGPAFLDCEGNTVYSAVND